MYIYIYIYIYIILIGIHYKHLIHIYLQDINKQLQDINKTSNEIPKERLKTQETFWIKILKTLTPSGLNQDLN